MDSKSVLISIHPEYVNKILEREKCVEFRRTWASREINEIVIYATAPISRIVAIARVTNVLSASPNYIWKQYKDHGPGISRMKLMKYFHGKSKCVAIELNGIEEFVNKPQLESIFGDQCRPPQSFQYIDGERLQKLKRYKRVAR
jgi:predicted transcriptional regulator